MHKTWNVRDQTENELKFERKRIYKDIEAKYRLIKRVSEKDDAKEIIDEIWTKKKWADDIEMELLRREYNNGETQ